MAKFWLMIATLIASNVSARPIEIVMIDHAEETELGRFPIDRAHIAAAIEAIERAGAGLHQSLAAPENNSRPLETRQ
jgi:hypothetical protein